MNRPKAPHFVPQNQQRRFQDEEGNLFIGIKEQNKVIPISTYSAMQQSELYSTLVTEPMEGKDNRYDSRLEQDFFAPLDGQWAAMCDEILDITAHGNLPEMDESTRRAFAQYVYNAYTCVPEVHQRSSVHQDPEGALRDTWALSCQTRLDALSSKAGLLSQPFEQEWSRMRQYGRSHNKIIKPSTTL